MSVTSAVSSTVRSAVILAGGLGTRLRSAVPDLPKPMAPIAGRPFLEYLLDYWIGQGVQHFVLSIGYRHEVITGHFGARYRDARIDYVIETEPLGTGGGLLLATEKIAGDLPFLLLNGDTYFAVELDVLSEFAKEKDADWCFSLFRTSEVGRYMGMDLGDQNQIVSLKSGSGLPGRLANGGVYLIHPRALVGGKFSPGDRVSLEDGILPAAMTSSQRLFGAEFNGSFIDIGVPDDYHRAHTVFAT